MSPEMLKAKLDKLTEESAKLLAELKEAQPGGDWVGDFARMVHHAYMRRRLD
jgi:hypothetical protein